MDEQSAISQEGFPTLEDTPTVANEQMTLFSLQELAVNNTKTVEQIQVQLKTAQEMYKDGFLQSEEYKSKDQEVKDKSRELKQVKERLSMQPSLNAQAQKIKELKNELKEKKAAISDYALEILRMGGLNEFDKDNESYEIKVVAKLVKVKQ